jgi:hypothetical protein
MNLSRFLPHRAIRMGFLGGGVTLFLDLLYHGGPGDSGWLPQLLQAAAFGLIFFLWGLLPESDDDDWPGKPQQELAEPPFVAKPTIRTRVMLVLLGLLFLGMLLWSISAILGLSESGTLLFHVVFAPLSIWFMVACLNDGFLRIRVSEKALEFRRLAGSCRIPLATVSSVDRLSPWYMYPAYTLAAIYQVRWTDSEGRARQISFGLDHENLHHGHALAKVLMKASTRKSARSSP